MDREDLIQKNRRLTRNIKDREGVVDNNLRLTRSSDVVSSDVVSSDVVSSDVVSSDVVYTQTKKCISCSKIEPIGLFMDNGVEQPRCYYCRETKLCSSCGKIKNLTKFPNRSKNANYCSQCEITKPCPTCGKIKKRMKFMKNHIEQYKCIECLKDAVSSVDENPSQIIDSTKKTGSYSQSTSEKIETRQIKQEYTSKSSSKSSSFGILILAIIGILILGILIFLLTNPLGWIILILLIVALLCSKSK